MVQKNIFIFFFSSRRRHTRCLSDWSSDVCSSDLGENWGGLQILVPGAVKITPKNTFLRISREFRAGIPPRKSPRHSPGIPPPQASRLPPQLPPPHPPVPPPISPPTSPPNSPT